MEIQQIGEANLIRFDRRVDSLNARALETELAAALAGKQAPTVVSLEQTEYISSAGLRLILTAGKKLKPVGFALACPSGSYVDEILVTAGFATIFKVFPTEAEALTAVREQFAGRPQPE